MAYLDQPEVYRATCRKGGVRQLLPLRTTSLSEIRRFVKQNCPRTGRIYAESYIALYAFSHGIDWDNRSYRWHP